MSRRDGLTIGRLAAGSGVNLETIRYYERIGLMPEPDRTPGGHRSYANEHRRRLTFIRRARELGFGLDGIRTLIVLSEPGRQSCAEVKKIAEGHLDIVRSKIADLVKLEAALQDASQRCGDGAVPDCPVIQVLGGA